MKAGRNKGTTQESLTANSRSEHLQLKLTRRREQRPFVLDVLFSALKLIIVAAAIMGFGALGLVYGVVSAYISTVPYFETSQLTQSDRSTTICDMYGNELTTMSAIEYREWVNIEDVPETLKLAFIAVEDVRFYKHQGVDFKRLFSAALEILGNSNSSGGSTLTQQLIKNKVLSSERTYKRKIQEAYLALQLEKEWDKDQILEAYLNDIYLGGSNYGVVTAAKDYFGKELSELTLRECALLAGLTQNPYGYNPRLNMYVRTDEDGTNRYERTQERTNTVLKRMYENGYITREQYNSALNENEVIFEESQYSGMYERAYFIEYAIQDVIGCWLEKDGLADTASNRAIYENKLRSGGYTIYTTMDTSIQDTVQESIANWSEYPELADPDAAEVEEVVSDSITIKTIEPQVAAVVIDSDTGELRAIIGGRTEPEIRKGINRAYQSYTEVGSSIKPLSIYGPALDNGVSPATIIANVPWTIDGWGGENGYPSVGVRETSRYFGPTSVREGLTESLNVVAGRLLFDYVGVELAVEYMERMGIPSSQLNKDGPGLALGTSGITPIQMASAYAAIANNGYYNDPISFTYVIDEQGNVILDAYEMRGASTQVYNSASTAYMLVDMMTDVVESGTGTAAKIEGHTVAGKTGTNSDYASVYFAGMTCDYTSVVWIGHDYPANKLKSGSTGGDYAAPLWQDFMSKIMEGKADSKIINADESSLGLITKTICPVSGLVACDACLDYYNYTRSSFGKRFALIDDFFTYSQVPTSTCDMHVSLKICTKSGCVACDKCAVEDITTVTYCLIRQSSPFYRMSDELLAKVFGDTYKRTAKSTEDFTLEFPICSICGAEVTPTPDNAGTGEGAEPSATPIP